MSRKRRCTIRRCKYLYWLVDGKKIPHRPAGKGREMT